MHASFSSTVCLLISPSFNTDAGPRKQGEGCEDEEQGILLAEQTENGGAKLAITLLAAGFVIGR